MFSFIQHFAKYITFRKDHNELLLHTLLLLVREEQRFMQAQQADYEPTNQVDISVESFENKAHELEIFSFADFYDSELFSSNSFAISDDGRTIIKTF